MQQTSYEAVQHIVRQIEMVKHTEELDVLTRIVAQRRAVIESKRLPPRLVPGNAYEFKFHGAIHVGKLKRIVQGGSIAHFQGADNDRHYEVPRHQVRRELEAAA
jgi:hypothetical protein